ncbi:MAG TPA: hypothetical protein VFM49_28530 [Chloroflexia bacterium]|nr:hypothetical protein [Chloroflexia bacterium]
MRRGEDLMESWQWDREMGLDAEVIAAGRRQIAAALDTLETLLDNPSARTNDLYSAGFRLSMGQGVVGLLPEDRARAEALYRRVFAAGGAGSRYMQEGLLLLLAATEDAASIPFWLEIVDWNRPRDQAGAIRRRIAPAALARLAARRNVPEAYAALRTLLHHPHPEVRALSARDLSRAYWEVERPLPPEVADELADLALHDKDFMPRFEAREALHAAGLPLSPGNLGGSYTFKVKPRRTTGINRTIEVLSQQSLDDLHLAIQDAFDWDNDHLYSFYLTTGANRDDYEIACAMAEGDWSGSPFLQIGALGDGPEPAGSANGDEDDEAGGGPLTTADAVIGALGLGLKHKFIYLFDYGDQNEFEVQVVSIQAHAAPGDYPRIVASEGKAPAQYAVWDDEEDEGYEDGDDSDDA